MVVVILACKALKTLFYQTAFQMQFFCALSALFLSVKSVKKRQLVLLAFILATFSVTIA
jgi:uncharacterized membrane protein YgdD (TMEM256/DUF423 family)